MTFATFAVALLAVAPQQFASVTTAQLAGQPGCVALRNVAGGPTLVSDATACGRRRTPCSTFKLPHALIALETGVLTGPDHRLAWDGTKQFVPSWERDHTLASAIQHSVVWYFQRTARRIGPQRMAAHLARLGYGNQLVGADIEHFWLGTPLAISAIEQLDWLTKLYRDELPYRAEVMAQVRAMAHFETRHDSVLSGKTGSDWDGRRFILGRFVGHLATPTGAWVIAVDLPRPNTRGDQARALAEAVLVALGLWQAN